MKKFLIIVSVVLFLSCVHSNYENSQDEMIPDKITSTKNDKKKDESSLQVGPKMDFKPSINLRNGKIELGPSLDFGPRIDF